MGKFGMAELLVVLLIVLLLFGGAKIPQLAKSLGEGIKEFKKSIAGKDDNDNKTEKHA
jgi:sec-independent protein translocase protein TatA